MKPGRVVEVRDRDRRVEIEPAPVPMSLARRAGGRVAVPEEDLPLLTDEIVVATIEQTRRSS